MGHPAMASAAAASAVGEDDGLEEVLDRAEELLTQAQDALFGGEVAQAAELCREALTVQPDLDDAHRTLLLCLEQEEKWSDAIDASCEWAAACGTSASQLTALSRAAYRAGDSAMLLRALRGMITVRVPDTDFALGRAMAADLRVDTSHLADPEPDDDNDDVGTGAREAFAARAVPESASAASSHAALTSADEVMALIRSKLSQEGGASPGLDSKDLAEMEDLLLLHAHMAGDVRGDDFEHGRHGGDGGDDYDGEGEGALLEELSPVEAQRVRLLDAWAPPPPSPLPSSLPSASSDGRDDSGHAAVCIAALWEEGVAMLEAATRTEGRSDVRWSDSPVANAGLLAALLAIHHRTSRPPPPPPSSSSVSSETSSPARRFWDAAVAAGVIRPPGGASPAQLVRSPDSADDDANATAAWMMLRSADGGSEHLAVEIEQWAVRAAHPIVAQHAKSC